MLELDAFSGPVTSSENRYKGAPGMSGGNHLKSCSPENEAVMEISSARNKTRHTSAQHRVSRNSSEDPSISSTQNSRSSASRTHPRASNHSSSSHDKSRSNSKFTDHYHRTPKRKRSSEDEEGGLWTEHVSSSGRVYYYNKKEDKSQWEKPKGFVKKPKEDLVSPGKSRRSTASGSTHSTPHAHKSLSNHRKSRNESTSASRGDLRGRDQSSAKQWTEGSLSKHTSAKSLKSPMLKPVLVSPTTPVNQTTPQLRETLAKNGENIGAAGIDGVSGRLDYSQGMVGNGPITPDIPHNSSAMHSPQQPAGLTDSAGLHPLQQAFLLQNQFSQQQQVYDPLNPPSALPGHMSGQLSHPNSPLVQSPLVLTPPVISSPLGQPNMFPTSIHGAYNTRGLVSSVSSATLRGPMSRLGYVSVDGQGFPDVSSLKCTHGGFSKSTEVMSKTLAGSWIRHNDPLQSQVDNVSHESLRLTVRNSMVVNAREALSKLSVESLQLSHHSTDLRLKALDSLMNEVNNT